MHVAAGGILLRPNADRTLRDRVEGPQQLAVGGVVGFDEAADAVFAAIGADQDFSVDDGRRHGLAVAERGLGDLHRPDRLAGLGVERDQLGVERGEIDLVAIDRGAAIVGPAAIDRDRPHVVLVVPDLLAGLRVECVDVIERRGHIHHAVDDDRRGLHRFAQVGLKDPGDMHIFDVARRDLIGRMETRLIVVAVGVQEVLAVARRVVEHRLADCRYRHA